MIQYSLKCEQDHRFDSWFQSAGAFDKLHAAGHVTCAVCGSDKVEKAIMAPRVNNAQGGEPAKRSLGQPESVAEQALAALKKHVEKNATYVGGDFVREARAIHDGEAPERAIYGEARIDEARKLAEDGVPVAPLPFTPNRKSN